MLKNDDPDGATGEVAREREEREEMEEEEGELGEKEGEAEGDGSSFPAGAGGAADRGVRRWT